MKIQNALIESVFIGSEGHGIMTASIGLKIEGGGVSFGGYALDTWDKNASRRVPTVAMGIFVHGVLDAVGCEEWGNLVGMPCRVEFSGDGRLGDRAIAIGHFYADKWFRPEESFAHLNK